MNRSNEVSKEFNKPSKRERFTEQSKAGDL